MGLPTIDPRTLKMRGRKGDGGNFHGVVAFPRWNSPRTEAINVTTGETFFKSSTRKGKLGILMTEIRFFPPRSSMAGQGKPATTLTCRYFGIIMTMHEEKLSATNNGRLTHRTEKAN